MFLRTHASRIHPETTIDAVVDDRVILFRVEHEALRVHVLVIAGMPLGAAGIADQKPGFALVLPHHDARGGALHLTNDQAFPNELLGEVF